MLDDRAKFLLKTLVERYIADGQPVGSRTLSRANGIELSPATVRNVMADLEELGLIVSPHTSAGRVPTDRAYRFFVDTLMRSRPMEGLPLDELRAMRTTLQHEDDAVSYVRRLAQARLDLARAELRNRAATEDVSSITGELPSILSTQLTGGPARPPRPPRCTARPSRSRT